MAKLSNEDDRKEAESAVSSSNVGNFLKIEEGHNFIVLLDEGFEQGFLHWVHIGDKIYRRVCKDGLENKGWNPDGCEICALTSEQYDLKKEAKSEGDKALAKEYNDRGNKLRANYSAVFRAVKIKAIIERVKNKKTGKMGKRYVPDFDEVEVGKLQLTHSQLKRLFLLVEINEETGELPFNFIEDGKDLVNRPLDFIKKKEDKKLYAEVKTVMPMKQLIEFEVAEGDVPDVTDEFEFTDDLDKIVALYRGEIDGLDEDEYEEQEIDKKTSKGKGKKSNKDKDDI